MRQEAWRVHRAVPFVGICLVLIAVRSFRLKSLLVSITVLLEVSTGQISSVEIRSQLESHRRPHFRFFLVADAQVPDAISGQIPNFCERRPMERRQSAVQASAGS